VFEQKKNILLVYAWQKEVDYSVYILEDLCVQQDKTVLNEYVLYIINYVIFDLFGDREKEEWSKKVLLDKFGGVYSVFVSSKFAAICHEYIYW